MKKIFLALLLLCTFSMAYSQSYYTTESKSCGACGKEVSIYSRVGMRCPHCGVIWGRENEHRTTSYRYDTPKYEDGYDEYEDYSYKGLRRTTTAKLNLRYSPSTKSSIVKQLPIYTSVTIQYKKGDWYYVNCDLYDEYLSRFQKYEGYVHSSYVK